MIEILRTAPSISARKAERMLTDGIVWLDTFRLDTQFKKQILDWLRLDQLKKEGIDEDDEVIGFYSFSTSMFDSEKAFNTHYTLDDTGEFYRSLFITALIDSFVITGDTAKMEDQEWWRDEILGLNERNMEKLRDGYKERLIIYAERVLFNNL
tara:strand:- start:448 stop:906 length:459 start_codon:yes stop_codon:yes gene_type:complete